MSDLNNIVARCKQQEKQAQAELYKLLAPKLLGVCYRYLLNRDDAEDAMQESFIKLFLHINQYKGEGAFEGWAKRIAVNTALQIIKQKNKLLIETKLTIVENIEDTIEEETIDARLILQCLSELPIGYRTIINLFLLEEFSHHEISEKLNITESTSRSQYTRARQALLKLVNEKIKSEALHG